MVAHMNLAFFAFSAYPGSAVAGAMRAPPYLKTKMTWQYDLKRLLQRVAVVLIILTIARAEQRSNGGGGWAEWIVRAPVKVAPGVEVQHYSNPVRMECHSSVFRI